MKRKILKVSLSLVGMAAALYLSLAVLWGPGPPKEWFAKGDIDSFKQLLAYHKEMHGKYPDSLRGIDKELLPARWEIRYVDPWGYEYHYEIPESGGYDLYSVGMMEEQSSDDP